MSERTPPRFAVANSARSSSFEIHAVGMSPVGSPSSRPAQSFVVARSDRVSRPRRSLRREAQTGTVAPVSAVGLADDPLPDLGRDLVREADEVAVVGDDRRVRQRLTGRGAVGGAGTGCDDLHPVFSVLSLLVEPADYRLAGPAGGLPKQTLPAVQVDEVGLEPFAALPPARVRVLGPLRAAAAGLVDTHHPHRAGWGQ
jgi:hypothetical protein